MTLTKHPEWRVDLRVVAAIAMILNCGLLVGCGIGTARQIETTAASGTQPADQSNMENNELEAAATPADDQHKKSALATFGGGCFWCVEAVFLEMRGVLVVESGYEGGHVVAPTYQQVCVGNTGHAEVCRIQYDPSAVTYEELLEVFWKTHDPTTLNQQGADVGTQYRSVIFYHNEEQKMLAEKYKQKLDAAHVFSNPIVTEISPAQTFYKAEDSHQNYFARNPFGGYCAAVVRPKVEKFKKVFPDKVKQVGR